ncbi:ArsR family transcriptional regulator [Nitrosopumilus cobalaminigenes]|uniref:ArsR family transcriptional regulator n=1 Tax=Nitrosopumilus cobalaminigenes TaxID=1470066 RepID=UPI001FE403B7|nr:ArsR family transcriptional regulator [Nitrosopumilus cobalaminigenes]
MENKVKNEKYTGNDESAITSFSPGIDDEEIRQTFLNIISDNSSRMILDSIIDTAKSILEISDETQVPLRTVYRKIQLFHDSKLLKISGTVTDSGKKYFLYKSKVRSISISYHPKELIVNIIKN